MPGAGGVDGGEAVAGGISAGEQLVAHNPVIRGFAPDPSIVRAGDWYYLATSSFEWFPTIPLYRSRDLAHWEHAGHVTGAAPGNSLAGVPDSGGIWAPSLSWDGERFWVTYAVVRSVGTPYFDLDVYVTNSPRAEGPWAPPRRVPSHGFDPALFHEDGRLWLLNLQNDHRPDGKRFSGIVATELNPVTLAPVAPTALLLQHERLVEGPKLLRHDGWYHLILAEGGTGYDHGVLTARSRELTGPYELSDHPMLTSRDAPTLPLQKAGHAELVQTPDGAWFLSHLAGRPLPTPQGPRCTLGRETAIQAVTWDEGGWPRLRGGGWHPAEEVPVPGPTTARAEGRPNLRAGSGNPAQEAAVSRPTAAQAEGCPTLRDGNRHPAQEVPVPGPTAAQPAAPMTSAAPPEGPTAPRPDGSSAKKGAAPKPPAESVPPPGPSGATAAELGRTEGTPSAPGTPRPLNSPMPPASSSPLNSPSPPTSCPTPTPLGWPWSTLREPPDPSWADTDSRPGWIRLRGRQGPESRWAQSLLAQRLTEHHAEARVTVDARPTTFTQAAGLLLRYDAEGYVSLDLTWCEPAGEGQRGQQWGGGGRTVLSLVERDFEGAREVAVADVGADGPLTLGVTVDGALARFWYLRGAERTYLGPKLDVSKLSDDHGGRLRFTGTLAGIHARDLVDAAFTADFRDFQLACAEGPSA